MENLSFQKIQELKSKALEIRKSILRMLNTSTSGHTAGPLGMTDIFTYLYFYELKHDSNNPSWEERDRVVLSNGHICPVLYTTMAYAGYYDLSELETLRKFKSKLQGHPHREFLPQLETSSGPLGSGLSQAVGMAIGLKMDNKPNYVYCFTGDGELNEGQNWEAFMLASKAKLDNLIIIIDRNKIQLDGKTENIMPLENLKQKLESFNLNTIEIDGHSFSEINNSFNLAKSEKNKPSVIIANTIASKGIKAWEGDYNWHGKAPNKEELEIALNELDSNK